MITGKPSNTARLIARSILAASRDKKLSLLAPPGAEEITSRILQHSKGDRLFRIVLHKVPRSLLFILEKALLPGIIAHYLVRKRKIEQFVRDAISLGAKEVVVIAAGYDSLCLRLREEFPHVHFLEIDHPATQEAKKAAFPEKENLRYLACDLAQEPLPPMPAHEARVFVVEGLTMYLHESEVAALFKQIHTHGHTLIFTFMEKAINGSLAFRNQSRIVETWLRWRGEPFRWGISHENLPAFLAAQGFRCTAVLDHADLRHEILEPLGLPHLALVQGECLCLATRIQP